MKKTLLLVAAIVCSGAVAQEKEVWACQGVDTNGFKWENRKWERIAYAPSKWLLSLDRNDGFNVNGSIKTGERNYLLRCRDLAFLTCTSHDGIYVSFDRARGAGSVASTLGSAFPYRDGSRDSIYIEPIQCTKF